MNELYYENQGTTTYLVCKVEKGDNIDSMSLGMLTNNKIPGLAQTFFMQMDSERYIKFNVSAKVSVSQLFSSSVNRRQLLGVFLGIVDAMISAEDYMLEVNNILLDMDYIFTDVSTCETVLICLPIEKADTEETKPDMRGFFRNIMFSTHFNQTENCDYIAKIINHLNSTAPFSLHEFKKVLDEQKGAAVQTAAGRKEAAVYAAPGNPKVPVQSYSQPQMQQGMAPVQKPAGAVQQGTVNVNPVNTVEHQQTVNQQMVMPKPIPEKKEASKSNKTKDKKQAKSNKKQVNQGQAAEAAQASPDVPEMTFMYLMQHYSKENKAIYDAQKEAKKANQPPKQSEKQTKKKSAKQPKAAKQDVNMGFVIPGVDPTQQVSQQQVSQQQVSQQQVSNPVEQVRDNSKATAKSSMGPVVNQQMPVVNQQVPVMNQQMPAGASMGMEMNSRATGFGETTALVSPFAGETTVLVSGQHLEQSALPPYLIRRKNNEKIDLNKPVFRIGKERSYADYFIGDNTAISRSHANIVNHDGEYFLVDTNSTNHTFLNGEMLQSNVEAKLSQGDSVRLANEDFEFRFY